MNGLYDVGVPCVSRALNTCHHQIMVMPPPCMHGANHLVLQAFYCPRCSKSGELLSADSCPSLMTAPKGTTVAQHALGAPGRCEP